MNINLKGYQRTAVDDLLAKCRALLVRPGRQKVCVFKSPTGSGKTVMTAFFIYEFIREMHDANLCFLWFSAGKGNLHEQSAQSLRGLFDGAPCVSMIDEEFHGGRDRIKRNEVVVANWEKLFSQDRQGNWKSVAMRDGEKLNFRQVVENTRKLRKIVLIIDESHFGMGAERITELREIFDPNLIIEMSATPNREFDIETAKRGFAVVEVLPQAVIDAGMIKKAIPINPEIDEAEYAGENSEQAVLNMAFDKRLKLKELFEKWGANINPLVLVQMPNAEVGAEKIKIVQQFLAQKSITEKNGKLAIWLAEKQSANLAGIKRLDNEIEFLIFKQTVAMGWDCPRAHILVKLREPGGEVFEIQTVGRIGRMPEWKHYATDALNWAYIYTNNSSYSAHADSYNPNIINDLKATRQKIYADIDLVSYYKSRADYGDISSIGLIPVFEKTACKYFTIPENGYAMFNNNIDAMEKNGINFDAAPVTHSVVADMSVDPPWDTATITDERDNRDFELSASDTEIFFNQFIKENLGTFTNIKRSVPAVRETIYYWFIRFLGARDRWDGEPSLNTQRVCIRNRAKFGEILAAAVAEYDEIRQQEVLEKIEASEQFPIFNVYPEYHYNSDVYEKKEYPKSLLQPCYLRMTRSKPEENFEKYLYAHSGYLKWWWKNGESLQDAFAIRYLFKEAKDLKHMPHAFHPDYLVQLNDGRLGIFEIKADNDNDPKTKVKAEELQRYIKRHNKKKKKVEIFGGIVVHQSGWKIHQASKYPVHSSTRTADLSKWKLLDLAINKS